ncbi:collagen alpha-6(VI) chain-like [Mytilus galloprovincialis]|uniref:collagen alpha-6(VI) chain-like n=1 Tax=Mytilus galloprovincialis TaxID=29158 RepID=UPI003F7B50ED
MRTVSRARIMYILICIGLLMTNHVAARSALHKMCDIPVDIVFVLDTSASIGPINFAKQINFIHDVVDMLNIGPGTRQSRVAAVSFSSNVVFEFGFTDDQNKVDVLNAVDKINYVSGSSTKTYAGLAYVHKTVFATGNGERPGIANVVVVLTDGNTNPGHAPITGLEGKQFTQTEASNIRSLPAYVFAIGIGSGVDKTEINGIASTPSDTFSILVDSYDVLDTSVIKNTVLTRVCEVVPPPAPPAPTKPPQRDDPACFKKKADVFFIVDTSSSLNLFENVKKELNFVGDVIDAFDVGSDQVRVGMMTFSNDPEMLFQLDDFKTKEEIAKVLMEMNANDWKGGNTYMDKALRLLMKEGLSTSHGSRYGVPQIAVIITDGRATDRKEFEKAVNELRQTNYLVFAIGVGPDRDPVELKKIASDSSRVYEVENVQSLQAIRQELVVKLCEQGDQPAPPVVTCEGAQADVIFVADSSRSIGSAAFNELKKFAVDVVKRFTVSPSDIQVGLIIFGNDTNFEFTLGSYRDQDEVLKALSNVKYLQGMQLTYTNKALNLLTQQGFSNLNGGRGGKIPKIAILITDGEPTDIEATRIAAEKGKQEGIIIFAIGVGQYIDQTGLDIMASSPTETHSFAVDNYAALSSIEESLAEKTCTAGRKTKQG